MYEKLTKYIPVLEKKLYSGKCVGLSGYEYNSYVEHLRDDIYDFSSPRKNYYEILKKAGIDAGNYEQIDVSKLNGEIVYALIFTIVLREKFDSGLILKFCENGCFLKWLKRLKEIDGDQNGNHGVSK